MELQRLQGEQQLIAEAAQAEDPQQGGAAQGTLEPVAAVADHPRQQRRADGGEQGPGGRRAGRTQGLQAAGGQGIEQVAHHPSHQRAIGNGDGHDRYGRSLADQLEQQQAPDQLVDRARQRQQAPDQCGRRRCAAEGVPDQAGAQQSEPEPQQQAQRPAQQCHARGDPQPPQQGLHHQRIGGGRECCPGELADQVPAAAVEQLRQHQQHRHQHQGRQQHQQGWGWPHATSSPLPA